jgi:hypothetical protein
VSLHQCKLGNSSSIVIDVSLHQCKVGNSSIVIDVSLYQCKVGNSSYIVTDVSQLCPSSAISCVMLHLVKRQLIRLLLNLGPPVCSNDDIYCIPVTP